MQFPVPQFTDVEDKIIGGLTFKQFAIVFAAAVFTFVIYTISKSVMATIVTGVLTGVPALALVFGKLNGRPLYASAGNFIRFLFGAKVYVYHKEAKDAVEHEKFVQVEEAAPPKDIKATAVKIKELNYILQQQAEEEQKLVERISQNK